MRIKQEIERLDKNILQQMDRAYRLSFFILHEFIRVSINIGYTCLYDNQDKIVIN